MGEVIQFVRRSELERNRLIQRARAIYESVFPSADPIDAAREHAPAGQLITGRYRTEERLS
jgi:hypothetical protein